MRTHVEKKFEPRQQKDCLGKMCFSPSHYANVCFSMTLLELADCGIFHPQGVGKGKQMAKSMGAGSERNVFTQKHNITSSSGLNVFCVRTTGSQEAVIELIPWSWNRTGC